MSACQAPTGSPSRVESYPGYKPDAHKAGTSPAAPAALLRNTRAHPCLICGGHSAMPRGRGIRCAGFRLDRVAYCTRDEAAGSLPLDIGVSPPAYKHRLFGACGCGASHGWDALVETSQPAPRQRERLASVAARDPIYRLAIELLPLRKTMITELRRRGLDGAAIQAGRYRSIPYRGEQNREVIRQLVDRFGEARVRATPGFTDRNGCLTMWTAVGSRDGMVIPYIDVTGQITGLQARFNDGRYLSPRGARLAEMYHVAGVPTPEDDLFLTEGGLKAHVAATLSGAAVFGVAGQGLQLSHIEAIRRMKPRRVIVALDQEDNANTDRARERWIERLGEAGLSVFVAIWEGNDLGGPKGLDDLFAAGGAPRIRPVATPPRGLTEPRTPQPTLAASPIPSGVTLAEARVRTVDAIERFTRRRPRGQALLVATPPGTGKTTAHGVALKDHRFAVRVVVGTDVLVSEIADAFGYTPIRGRRKANCQRMDVVSALGKAGLPIERFACGTEPEPRCPHRESCVYLAQFERAGVWIGTSEQLFNMRFIRGSGLVVVDDADLGRSLVERVRVAQGAIQAAIDHPGMQRRRPAHAVLRLLAHALVDLDSPLGGIGFWDHLARTARRYGEDLAAVIRSLPRTPSLPTPSDAGPVTVADIEAAPPQTILRLLLALREELPAFQAGHAFNSRLRADGAGIDIWRARPPVSPPRGSPPINDAALLVLDATPVKVLVDHLTRSHRRQPDVHMNVRLPEAVKVVQYTGATRGHGALMTPAGRRELLAEIAQERDAHPVGRPEAEAAVGFLRLERDLVTLGFAPSQVAHFGNARGTNRLATVERLHLVGRPMPPSTELHYLAQVLHHGESWVSDAMELVARPYAGQPFTMEVLEFCDPRCSALLFAHREHEMLQVIHRARLFAVEDQRALLPAAPTRRRVHLVLHTSQPIPDLRVDMIHLSAIRQGENERRAGDAQDRILAAVGRLQDRGISPTVTAIAREARAHKRTVTKVLGTAVPTL